MVTMADKRDYYEVLGVDRSATADQIRRGLPQAGPEVPPGPQPGRRGGGGQVQGGGRGLRGAQPPGEAGPLRPLRVRRPGGRRGPAVPATSATSSRPSATSSARGSSATCSAAGGGRRARKGADIHCDVTLDLLEAAHGAAKVVQFERHEALRDLRRQRGQAGHPAGDLLLLRRQRPGGPAERLLLAANDLPLLPRRRAGDPRALPGLPRQRASSAAA